MKLGETWKSVSRTASSAKASMFGVRGPFLGLKYEKARKLMSPGMTKITLGRVAACVASCVAFFCAASAPGQHRISTHDNDEAFLGVFFRWRA